MKIEIWLDGNKVVETSAEVAVHMASSFKALNWRVVELYEQGKLTAFSPHYGTEDTHE